MIVLKTELLRSYGPEDCLNIQEVEKAVALSLGTILLSSIWLCDLRLIFFRISGYPLYI